MDALVTISTFTQIGYNSLEVLNVNGDDFAITGIGAAIPSTDPVHFTVPVVLTDADDDTDSGNSLIDVTLLPNTPTTLDASDATAPIVNYTLGTNNPAEVNFLGSAFNDLVSGNAFANVLAGGGGIDTLSGLADNDTLLGQAGNDTLTGGAGADTMTGGADTDTFIIASGGTAVTIGSVGNLGTISGYDVITDFNIAVDKLNLNGAPIAAANTTGQNGADSLLTIGGATVKSHAISNGIITFDDANTFSSALTLTSTAQVAAVVQYLRANDIGNAGATVAFTAIIAGVPHTFVYQQVGATQNATNDILVDLSNTTFASLTAVIGAGAIDPIILDLDGNGLSFSSLAEGVSFDLDADGRADRVVWNTSNDGILALDVDGSGTIDNGGEIFTPHFAGGDYGSGTEALTSLDNNGDGVIDAGDERFGALLVWNDANADGISQEDELASLADSGIASIDLKTVATGAEVDGQTVLREGSFTWDDGSLGSYLEMALEAELGTGENGGDVLTVELAQPSTGEAIAIGDDLEKPADSIPSDEPRRT